MFSIEQIDDIHNRLGMAETLAHYLRALHAIGVERSESFVADGHSEYFGKRGYKVVTAPVHEKFTVAETSNRERFLSKIMRRTPKGKTDIERQC